MNSVTGLEAIVSTSLPFFASWLRRETRRLQRHRIPVGDEFASWYEIRPLLPFELVDMLASGSARVHLDGDINRIEGDTQYVRQLRNLVTLTLQQLDNDRLQVWMTWKPEVAPYAHEVERALRKAWPKAFAPEKKRAGGPGRPAGGPNGLTKEDARELAKEAMQLRDRGVFWKTIGDRQGCDYRTLQSYIRQYWPEQADKYLHKPTGD